MFVSSLITKLMARLIQFYFLIMTDFTVSDLLCAPFEGVTNVLMAAVIDIERVRLHLQKWLLKMSDKVQIYERDKYFSNFCEIGVAVVWSSLAVPLWGIPVYKYLILS